MRIELERTYLGALLAIASLSLMACLGGYSILTAHGPLAGRLILTVVLCGPLMLWLVPGMIGDLRVYFSNEGIHRPRPFRRELFITWTEVDRVKMSTITPTLHAGRRRISIQLLTFRDPPAVWKLLEERLMHLRSPRN